MFRTSLFTLTWPLAASICGLLPLEMAAQEAAPLLPEETPLMAVESLGESLFEEPVSVAIPVADESAAELVEPVVGTNLEAPVRAARWRVAPHLELKATFDDNIFIDPDHEVSDFIFLAAPGISAGFWDDDDRREKFRDRENLASLPERGAGNFLFVDCTAILLGFARTSSENALDHDARFAAQWRLEKLTLGAAAHAESKSETNAEIGDRLRRTTVDVALTARYELSEKTAVEVDGFYEKSDYDDFVSTTEWRGEGFAEYAVTPLLRASFGLALGRIERESGGDQVFERILARAVYSLSEKMEIVGRGGVEFRQSDGGPGDRTNPIFELAATYQPAAGTRVKLEGFRRVDTSALQSRENLTRTGVVLAARRAIRDGFYLTVEGGYEHVEYTGSADGDRTDDAFFIRPGLLYNFAFWGNAAVGYEHRLNDSSRAESTFEDNQIFVQVGLSY